MSAIHRVDDIWSMNGPRFFRLAWRLPCYRGVMRERTLKEQQEREQSTPVPQQQAPGYAPAGSSTQPGTRAIIANDPTFAQIFSFG